MNPTAENEYWSKAYENEPYRKSEFGYQDYQPAYKLGYENRGHYAGKSFDQVESNLASDWEKTKGTSRLGWQDAKQATRAAWHRVERAMPGDADGDGR